MGAAAKGLTPTRVIRQTAFTMHLDEWRSQLLAWRQGQSLRREIVASRLGITVEWLRRLENGTAEPSDTLRLLVAEVTGIGAPDTGGRG